MKGTCGFELTLKGILVPDMQPTIGGLEVILRETYPELKVHGANMGPIWGRQDPGGPHESYFLGTPCWNCFDIKMAFYRSKDFYHVDKMILWPFFLKILFPVQKLILPTYNIPLKGPYNYMTF